MLLDQLRINDKYSYDDFEASLKERTVSEPKKKTIKDTVAYSNQTYDFSAINGDVYWNMFLKSLPIHRKNLKIRNENS